jgi:hypothetical protein
MPPCALRPKVWGATVTKRVQLVGPALLQTHTIEGGAGDVTLAHHPMVHMAEGGRLSFSPKRAVMTDPTPQYEGHNLWSLNQLRGDMHLDCEDGSLWDMRDYPAGHAVEDFAILVEARGATARLDRGHAQRRKRHDRCLEGCDASCR